MLRLTRPRACTWPVSYYTYTLSGIECFVLIDAGFGNRNSDHRDDISLRRGRIGSYLVR